MTTNIPKPEWFELADADNEGAFARRGGITRRGRIVALAAPLLLVATAFGYTQVSDPGAAVATQAVASGAIAQTTTQSSNSATAPTVTQASVTQASVTRASVTKPAASGAIGSLTPPTVKIAAGSDDDQEDNDD